MQNKTKNNKERFRVYRKKMAACLLCWYAGSHIWTENTAPESCKKGGRPSTPASLKLARRVRRPSEK